MQLLSFDCTISNTLFFEVIPLITLHLDITKCKQNVGRVNTMIFIRRIELAV